MNILAPNTLVQNRYLIIQLLGKGESGEVYLAVDQRLGNAVVLKKTAFPGNGNDAGFEHQAETLTRLRHPVLPKIETKFTEDNNLYLVAEHIQGDDLAQRVKVSSQPFPANWVLFWGDQLLDALAYLHSHEPPIIHGNIKPQNLKLNEENNIFLLDAGVLGRKTSVENGTPSTEEKLNYASREQLRGMPSDARSDIYSLSATLYTLLTGIVPPDAVKRADTVLSNLPDPLKPVNEANTEVSHTISEVILKGMSLNADARYQTAREMQKNLRDVYAEMQEAMTAQTVAFNAADFQSAVSQPPSLSVEQGLANDYYYGHSVPLKPDTAAAFPVTEMPSETVSGKTPYAEDVFQDDVSSQNYGAEISAAPITDNDVFAADAEEKFAVAPQSGQNGNGSSFKEISAVSQNGHYENYSPQNTDFGLESSGSNFENEAEEPYTAQSTVPLVSFDNKFDEVLRQSSADLPCEPPVENTAVNFPIEQEFNEREGQISNGNFTASVPPAVATAAAPPVVKKSNNKVFAVVGAGLAVVVLGTLAAAAGLYFIRPDGLFGSTTPTPVSTATPKESVITEVTPQPTVEATPETVASSNINANSDVVSSSDIVNTSADSNKSSSAAVAPRQQENVTEKDNSAVKTRQTAPQQNEPAVVQRPQQRADVPTSARPERTPKPPKQTATPIKKSTPKGPETL